MGYSIRQQHAKPAFVSGVIVWHTQRRTCAVDPNLRHKLGLSATLGFNEVAAEAYAGRVHPDDIDHAKKTADECRQTGSPYHIGYRLLDRDGVVFPIRQDGWWICADDGEPVSLVSTIALDPEAANDSVRSAFDEAVGLTVRIQRIAINQGWRDVEYMASLTRSEVARTHREHMKRHPLL